MRRFYARYIIVLLILSVGFGCSSVQKAPYQVENQPAHVALPPTAEKIAKALTIHGDTRIDNYYWLNQRENPKVVSYLTAENNYLNTTMKHTVKLQAKLYTEIVARLQPEDTSVPFLLNGYEYYKRYEKGKEYPIYCRKKVASGQEEILLNVNQMAKGYKFFKVGNDFAISPDNTLMAYGVDTISRRQFTLYFKNLTTGQILPDKIPDTAGKPIWANDNKTVFYVTKDEQTLREYKIFRHHLGTPVASDKEVFSETDETYSVEITKSKSQQYIFIRTFSTLASECFYLDATHPEETFQVIEPRQKDHEYSVEHYQAKWIIRSNYLAKNFKLVETPLNNPRKENWQAIVPHREHVFLDDFEVFKDYVVVKERQGGLCQLRVIRWDSRHDYAIEFDEATYAVFIAANQEFDTPFCRYIFTSLARPETTFLYNMNTKQKQVLKQEKVGRGFDPNNYKTEWLWATAFDGTPVPISMVYRKGIKKDGQNPLFLEAYGSYGNSFDVEFAIERISLLDRGFIYAIPHIRGGQEMGRDWYENGKLFKKKNTFSDYIDCAKYLIAEKYTCPAKLFANGGSAGGLLMGAVVNMNPALFKAVIAEVPFVDVVTTMLDKTIPLTTSEFDEWGDPTQKEYYDYMLSYSPYDNVAAKNYPAMLVTTGLHDSQVQYWEPAKWVAKLRALKTDKNVLLLHTNMTGGHDGVSGRFQPYRDSALVYAFVLDQLGQTR